MQINDKVSFLKFVYPISYNTTKYETVVLAVDDQKWPGRSETVWIPQDFPKSDLLAHVASFLNPPPSIVPTARLWTMSPAVLHSPNSGLGAGTHSNVVWNLITPRGRIQFEITTINLVLFKTGIGFLNLDARPVHKENQPAIWLDFLHYFRFVNGQRAVGIETERRVGYDPESKKPKYAPFVPLKTSFTAANDAPGEFSLQDILNAILHECIHHDGDNAAWREVFVPGQMLPFAALYVDDAEEAEVSSLLYCLRNFFHSKQQIIPTAADLSLQHSSLLPYAEKQWFTYSLDGGGFIAFDVPKTPFFLDTLPNHLKNIYFLLYLLTLNQRFTLVSLSEQVADQWISSHTHQLDAGMELKEKESTFAMIRERLLLFMARGYFTQVMQGEHHHRYYLKWYEILQIRQLYDEISDEVRYMYGYLQSEREKRATQAAEINRQQVENLERNLSRIAWVIGSPVLFLTFLQVIAEERFWVAVVVTLVGLVIGWLVMRLIQKNSDSGSK